MVVGWINLNNLHMKQEKETDKRETKDIIKNGFIYILVKLHRVGNSNKEVRQPCFMNNWGWALHSIFKLKRQNKPRKVKL